MERQKYIQIFLFFCRQLQIRNSWHQTCQNCPDLLKIPNRNEQQSQKRERPEAIKQESNFVTRSFLWSLLQVMGRPQAQHPFGRGERGRSWVILQNSWCGGAEVGSCAMTYWCAEGQQSSAKEICLSQGHTNAGAEPHMGCSKEPEQEPGERADLSSAPPARA